MPIIPAAFTVGGALAPETMEKIMTPVSTIARDIYGTDIDNLSETQKKFLELGDIVGMVVMLHSATKSVKYVGKKMGEIPIGDQTLIGRLGAISQKIFNKEPLSEPETKIVEEIIEKSTPEEIATATQATINAKQDALKEPTIEKTAEPIISEQPTGKIDIRQEPLTPEEQTRLQELKEKGKTAEDALTFEENNEMLELKSRETPIKPEPVPETKPVTETPVEAEVVVEPMGAETKPVKPVAEKPTDEAPPTLPKEAQDFIDKYKDNAEQLYKDHIENIVKERKIEKDVEGNKLLMSDDVLMEIEKNPTRSVEENVKSVVDRFVEERAKEPTGITKTVDAIDNILSAYSGKKNVVPEDFDLKKEVKRMIDGIIEELGYQGQQLINEIRKRISTLPKDAKDDIENLLPELIEKEKIEAKTTQPTNKQLKERGFYKKIQENKEISQEVKDALKDNDTARYYIPTTREINLAEANAIIEAKGLDGAMHDVINPSNNMHRASRTILRGILIKEFDKLGVDALRDANTKLAEEYFDKAEYIAEQRAKRGTEIGQELQAYND